MPTSGVPSIHVFILSIEYRLNSAVVCFKIQANTVLSLSTFLTSVSKRSLLSFPSNVSEMYVFSVMFTPFLHRTLQKEARIPLPLL